MTAEASHPVDDIFAEWEQEEAAAAEPEYDPVSARRTMDHATDSAPSGEPSPAGSASLNSVVLGKRVLRDRVAHIVCGHLSQYLKVDRIRSKEDFKHFSRKLTRKFTKETVTKDWKMLTKQVHEYVDGYFSKHKVYVSSSHERKR